MFARKKQPPIKSLIAQGTEVQGDITYTEGLRIDGTVIGNVRASTDDSILVVSETAHVQGGLQAAHLIINGTVNGPVHASNLLEIQPKARITGNVHYKTLEMHQGAVVAGQMCPLDIVVLEEKTPLKLESNDD